MPLHYVKVGVNSVTHSRHDDMMANLLEREKREETLAFSGINVIEMHVRPTLGIVSTANLLH